MNILLFLAMALSGVSAFAEERIDRVFRNGAVLRMRSDRLRGQVETQVLEYLPRPDATPRLISDDWNGHIVRRYRAASGVGESIQVLQGEARILRDGARRPGPRSTPMLTLVHELGGVVEVSVPGGNDYESVAYRAIQGAGNIYILLSVTLHGGYRATYLAVLFNAASLPGDAPEWTPRVWVLARRAAWNTAETRLVRTESGILEITPPGETQPRHYDLTRTDLTTVDSPFARNCPNFVLRMFDQVPIPTGGGPVAP